MPVMNGYEATRQIRALDDPALSGITILAMTANAFDEDSLGIWHGWILIQTDSYRRVNQYFTQQPAGLERV